jgi:hypothetical protein
VIVHRRAILRCLIASFGAVGILSPATLAASASPSAIHDLTNAREIRRALTTIFTQASASKAIGHKYLTKYCDEASAEYLWRMIRGSSTLSSPGDLKTHLRRLREKNFEEGEIVILDGWILARIEARACALVALI